MIYLAIVQLILIVALVTLMIKIERAQRSGKFLLAGYYIKLLFGVSALQLILSSSVLIVA